MAEDKEMDGEVLEAQSGAHIRVSLPHEIKTNAGVNILRHVEGRQSVERLKTFGNKSR